MDARRSRLDRMVRLYARRKGVPFGVAWKEFEERFNAGCRPGLHVLLDRKRREQGRPLKKKLSTPQALELIDKLDFAIQVADRMLG